MAIPFSRSLRSLEQDSALRPVLVAAFGGAVLLLWLLWSVLARVAVDEQSVAARLESAAEAHAVQAAVAGQVTAVRVRVGDEVEAGDVLVALDDGETRLGLDEARARHEGLEVQLDALQAMIETQGAAAGTSSQAGSAALAEARSQLAQAKAAAELARTEAERARTLAAAGHIAAAESERLQTDAIKAEAEAEAAARRVDLLGWDRRTEGGDRESHISEIRSEVALVESQVAAAAAAVARLEKEVEQHHLKAPVAGTVGELAPLRTGSIVSVGDVVGAVVPPGALKVVAQFRPPDAMGRVRLGQRARVRLEGFSWAQYGSLPASVSQVATEPRDGLVRVELTLAAPEQSAVPLQHGLPCAVEVEVERVSPATLLLRVAGARLGGRPQGVP